MELSKDELIQILGGEDQAALFSVLKQIWDNKDHCRATPLKLEELWRAIIQRSQCYPPVIERPHPIAAYKHIMALIKSLARQLGDEVNEAKAVL